jgi:hypothetical protein
MCCSRPKNRPTVCLGITSVVACTYRCDDGRIAGIVPEYLFFEELELTIKRR